MATHELKCWTEPFDSIWDGSKKHEVRNNDRGFDKGDVLLLREYEPVTRTYTGRWVRAVVTYLSRGGFWGLPPDVCVMSLDIRERHLAVEGFNPQS